MKELIQRYLPDAIQIRRHLHQIPELKYEEKLTSSFIDETLRSYGYSTQRGVGKTGIVALLDSGRAGKTIALRADIDALPISEATQLPYQSRHPGLMHACGHDGHTATLLLVARVLQDLRAQLKGKIKLIFQPAEEGGKGSTAMIEDGVLKDPDVDAIYGYHNWPDLPLHTFATREGAIFTGSGRFEITLKGKRVHPAKPDSECNPVILGARIIAALETLKIPQTVINLLGFNSGDWKLGTSEQAELVGCYFVEDEKGLSRLKKEMQSILPSHATAQFHEFHSPTLNTPAETKLAFAAAYRAAVPSIQHLTHCQLAADDFSAYLKQVPGCYFLIGAGPAAPVHTPHYNFPDEILLTAASVLLQIALA